MLEMLPLADRASACMSVLLKLLAELIKIAFKPVMTRMRIECQLMSRRHCQNALAAKKVIVVQKSIKKLIHIVTIQHPHSYLGKGSG